MLFSCFDQRLYHKSPGASDGIRTRFPLLGRQMLDQMSFTRRPAQRAG